MCRTSRCSTLCLLSRTLRTGTRSTCNNILSTTVCLCDCSGAMPWRGCRRRDSEQASGSTSRSKSTARCAVSRERFETSLTGHHQTLKYGIISVDALCRDLLEWETLYISGRTQKPVCPLLLLLEPPPHPTSQVRILHDDARVRLCNQVNLASAVRTALLLLPEEFTEVELFETIAGLSYRGDFRMAVGENPLKVRNIVHAQLDAFRSLYGGLLKSFWKSVYVIGEQPLDGTSVRIVRQDRSSKQRAEVASKLPSGLTSKLLAYYERKWNLKRALGEAGEEVELSTLDQAERWERIVLDDEFVQMLEKSAYDFVSLLRRALTGFGSQVSRRSSVDPRSTSPSRASSPLDRSSHSATSGPSFARSGEQSQRRRSRRRRRRSLDGRSTLHSFPLIPRSLPHSLYYIAVPLHFDPSQPSQSTLELVVAS